MTLTPQRDLFLCKRPREAEDPLSARWDGKDTNDPSLANDFLCEPRGFSLTRLNYLVDGWPLRASQLELDPAMR